MKKSAATLRVTAFIISLLASAIAQTEASFGKF
jgi:hypothetical protein